MSRILPPKEDEGPKEKFSLYMPKGMIAALDKAAAETGYTRAEVINHFCRWALEEYEKEKRAGKK